MEILDFRSWDNNLLTRIPSDWWKLGAGGNPKLYLRGMQWATNSCLFRNGTNCTALLLRLRCALEHGHPRKNWNCICMHGFFRTKGGQLQLVPLPVACLVWWYSFCPQIYDESETDQILNAKYFVWKNYTLGKWGLREAFNQNSLMQLFNGDRHIVHCLTLFPSDLISSAS